MPALDTQPVDFLLPSQRYCCTWRDTDSNDAIIGGRTVAVPYQFVQSDVNHLQDQGRKVQDRFITEYDFLWWSHGSSLKNGNAMLLCYLMIDLQGIEKLSQTVFRVSLKECIFMLQVLVYQFSKEGKEMAQPCILFSAVFYSRINPPVCLILIQFPILHFLSSFIVKCRRQLTPCSQES